jgi:ArsR family transcriptional regulator
MVTAQQAPLDPGMLADAAAMIRVLGHPVRLRIVECLEAGERSVGDLVVRLRSPQAIVSQQLAKMRAAGILSSRREGTSVFYQVADERVVRVLDCLRHCHVPARGGRSVG